MVSQSKTPNAELKVHRRVKKATCPAGVICSDTSLLLLMGTYVRINYFFIVDGIVILKFLESCHPSCFGYLIIEAID